MNIWLPIIVNLIPLLITLGAIVVGLKNGFRVELIKLSMIIGALVSCYFLTPVIFNVISHIEFLADKLVYLQAETVKSFIFLLTFLLLYVIIVIVCFVIKRFTLFGKLTHVNTAKRAKVRGASRRETKSLKREQKQLSKANIFKKHISTKSKVLSVVFGLIIGIIISATLLLPVKYTFKEISIHNENLQQINKGYEYTPYGQLDNLIHYSDFIVKK